MIIILKGNSIKQKIIKVASIFFLITMFAVYYLYMSSKFQQMNNNLQITNHTQLNTKHISRSQKLEDIIYNEAKVIVKLLGQKNVKYIKAVKDKLLISCDYDTDLEPLLVRYGVNAMVKKSIKDVKIAIDLAIIVENKYEK
jgi:hypothetical protein